MDANTQTKRFLAPQTGLLLLAGCAASGSGTSALPVGPGVTAAPSAQAATAVPSPSGAQLP